MQCQNRQCIKDTRCNFAGVFIKQENICALLCCLSNKAKLIPLLLIIKSGLEGYM